MTVNAPTRPLLILDLDETLIFGSESEIGRTADFRAGPFFVYLRPFVSDFLASVSKHFDLAVWSSASVGYVAKIAHELRIEQDFDWVFVWSRGKCIQKLDPEWMDTIFLKDLKKTRRFGYDLDRTIIVDDTRKKVSRNYGNAIYPSPYEGDAADRELPLLANYLEWLKTESNFRRVEKRGWRNRMRQGPENAE